MGDSGDSEQSWLESKDMSKEENGNEMKANKKKKHYISKDQTKLSFNFLGQSQEIEASSSPISRRGTLRKSKGDVEEEKRESE